jgi:hypothetical protein
MSRLTPAATAKMEFMDEEPKSIWKKSWKLARRVFISWLAAFTVICIAMFITLFVAFRWLCCWRNLKRSGFLASPVSSR